MNKVLEFNRQERTNVVKENVKRYSPVITRQIAQKLLDLAHKNPNSPIFATNIASHYLQDILQEITKLKVGLMQQQLICHKELQMLLGRKVSTKDASI